MSNSNKTRELLRSFQFERVLSSTSSPPMVYLLGNIGSDQTIVQLVKPAFDFEEDLQSRAGEAIFASGQAALGESSKSASNMYELDRIDGDVENDIYHWGIGWFTSTNRPADVKLTVIYPATQAHIDKYSVQRRHRITETSELYSSVHAPYIASFPESRLKWVRNILDGVKEADRVVAKDEDPELGWVMLPDLKWDEKTKSMLYLTAIARDSRIHTLRQLTHKHIPMLRKILDEAMRVSKERYGVEGDQLRMFVHYPPSYYHFHVHIVSIDFEGFKGADVGRAHLLEDLISLLELSPPDEPLLGKMDLTYYLGEQDGLWKAFQAALA